MEEQRIKNAASEHALEQLGQEQYDTNPSAVEAISEDFTAGVNWFMSQLISCEVKD